MSMSNMSNTSLRLRKRLSSIGGMIAVRFFSPEEFSKKLSAYGCKKIADVMPCVELWATGWDEPFTVSTDSDGRIDEWEHRRVLEAVIARTMPPDWNGSVK